MYELDPMTVIVSLGQVGAVSAIVSWFFKRIMSTLDDLKKSDAKQTLEIEKIKLILDINAKKR